MKRTTRMRIVLPGAMLLAAGIGSLEATESEETCYKCITWCEGLDNACHTKCGSGWEADGCRIPGTSCGDDVELKCIK
jgi:hypothetical protein